jgi:hypothetical protein
MQDASTVNDPLEFETLAEALTEYTDNLRTHLDESDPSEVTEDSRARLNAAEAILERVNAVYAALADGKL